MSSLTLEKHIELGKILFEVNSILIKDNTKIANTKSKIKARKDLSEKAIKKINELRDILQEMVSEDYKDEIYNNKEKYDKLYSELHKIYF